MSHGAIVKTESGWMQGVRFASAEEAGAWIGEKLNLGAGSVVSAATSVKDLSASQWAPRAEEDLDGAMAKLSLQTEQSTTSRVNIFGEPISAPAAVTVPEYHPEPAGNSILKWNQTVQQGPDTEHVLEQLERLGKRRAAALKMLAEIDREAQEWRSQL